MNLKTNYYNIIRSDFSTHIKATKSLKSGDHYTSQVTEFLEFIEERNINNLNKVDREIMLEYYAHLSTRANKRTGAQLKPSTINDNLSSLRMLSKRMLDSGHLKRALEVPNNIKIEGKSITREILTTDEIKIAYKSCVNNKERALIALAYGCGLRRSELQELNESKINYAKRRLTALVTKNNKTRTVSISDFFLKAITDYGAERLDILSKTNRRTFNYFLNSDGKRTSGDRLNRILKEILLRTNEQSILEKHITLHCLRHSIATHLIDAGESYDNVKEFLGHSFTDTSSIYAKNRKIKNYYTV